MMPTAPAMEEPLYRLADDEIEDRIQLHLYEAAQGLRTSAKQRFVIGGRLVVRRIAMCGGACGVDGTRAWVMGALNALEDPGEDKEGAREVAALVLVVIAKWMEALEISSEDEPVSIFQTALQALRYVHFDNTLHATLPIDYLHSLIFLLNDSPEILCDLCAFYLDVLRDKGETLEACWLLQYIKGGGLGWFFGRIRGAIESVWENGWEGDDGLWTLLFEDNYAQADGATPSEEFRERMKDQVEEALEAPPNCRYALFCRVLLECHSLDLTVPHLRNPALVWVYDKQGIWECNLNRGPPDPISRPQDIKQLLIVGISLAEDPQAVIHVTRHDGWEFMPQLDQRETIGRLKGLHEFGKATWGTTVIGSACA